MAKRLSIFNVASWLWLVVASADVTTFNPRTLDADPAPSAEDKELLVVLAEGNFAGTKTLESALQSLDTGSAGLTRERGLQVSQCLGCPSFSQVLARYHLHAEDLPLALLFPRSSENTRQGKFRLDLKGVEQPLQAMVKFVKAYDDSNLKSWVRSLPVPKTEEQQGPVHDVVGKTFEREVIDSSRHVLLLIYSEHDATSNESQLLFQQLGKLLHSNTGKNPFRLKQFDNDANDIPPSVNLEVKHVPQISLFRDDDKGDPDIFPQDEKHTMENILAWLHEMLPQRNYGLDALFAKVAKAEI